MFLRVSALIFFIVFQAASAFALPDDKNQPMYVQADTVSFNNKTGFSQYIGHVSVQQGSIHLTAQTAEVHMDTHHQIQEAVAKGTANEQAHYWSLPELNKPELNAYADLIRVYPQKHLVYLIGNAKVSQGKDSYSAPEIQYNSETESVFSKKSPAGKTVIVIHPNDINHLKKP